MDWSMPPTAGVELGDRRLTTKDGKFVKEFDSGRQGRPCRRSRTIHSPNTGKEGSAGGVGFSVDPQQKYLYISDLSNNTVWFL